MSNLLYYMSDDGYFKISESLKEDTVIVNCIFGTPIFGIDRFKTIRTYNLKGQMIKYENSLGDIINYKEPKDVLTPPRILRIE